MSLYDAVVQRWRAACPGAPVEQALAVLGPDLRRELDVAEAHLRERRSQHAFQRWLDQQALAGRDFDEAQLRWLDGLRQDLAAHGELAPERGRYAAAAGPEKAQRLFGRRTLDEVIASLSTALGPAKKPCGCGGTCSVGSGSCGCRKPAPAATASAPSPGNPRAPLLQRGALPDTEDDFAVYDVLAAFERKADDEPDDIILGRLLARVDARIAEGEAERYVVAVLGRNAIETRAEAILLRGAGWDAVPLLLEEPALAIIAEPFAHVVAVRDAHGRLAIHPSKKGALNHLFAAIREAEEKVAELDERSDLPSARKAHLTRYALALWAAAREAAPKPVTRREFPIPEHEDRGLSGHAADD